MPAVDPSPLVCIGPAIARHGETGACPHAAVSAWDGAAARRRRSWPKRCADCKRERKRRLMAYSRVGWDRAHAGTFFCPGPETPDDPHYWCGMEIDFRTRLTRCNACQERRLLWKAELRLDLRSAGLRPRRGRAAPRTDRHLRRHPAAPGTCRGQDGFIRA